MELFPDSAMSCALAEHGVWDVDRRDEFLIGVSRRGGHAGNAQGVRADSVFIDGQDEAYDRGQGVIDEVDVARALVKRV